MTPRRTLLAGMTLLIADTLAGCGLPALPLPAAPTALPVVFPTAVTLPSEAPSATVAETAMPSETPVPTSTPTAPPTSTQTPQAREGATAAFLSKAPKIDGPWGEWDTTQYPIKNLVAGTDNWSGEDDLRASYRVGWDAKNLYLAVKVIDDIFMQKTKGADLFEGDSIELLLSTSPDADTSSGLSAADFQIGVSPGRPELGDNTEAYLFYPQSKKGSVTNAVIGVQGTPDGYRIEFAIPWSVLGVTPAKGNVFGFAVSASDNDSSSKNVQQTVVSNVAKRVVTDPTTWGLLTLR